MQTTNIAVTASSWTKIADSTQDFVLSGASRKHVEVALTDADAAPSGISGHSLLLGPGNEALSRGSVGTGFVWVRLHLADTTAGAFLVVTK